jgi:ribonuclease PH
VYCSLLLLLLLLLQVLASVFGPREVESRADIKQDRAIVKCEYAMANFSTGEQAAALHAAEALTTA